MPAHPMKKKVPRFPHPMFKGVVKAIAKTVADHNRLEKMGYTHTKPKK